MGLMLASCGKFNKLLKSDDTEAKYDAAVKYYYKKDFFRAGQLFDDLLQLYRGTLRAEEVYYYYAHCKYQMAEIPTAAFHFRNFYETYPNSKYAEECFYMYAYCTYIEAYPFNLDPTYTYKAIDEFQLFVNVYPQSTYVEKCNQLIDDCRLRLQNKASKIAKLYYNIEDYKAAMVSYKNLVRDYPDLNEKEREEAEYLIVKSAYKYAEQSIEYKQVERYKDVLKAYASYKDQYPKGQYINNANEYAIKAQIKIEGFDYSKIVAAYKLVEQSHDTLSKFGRYQAVYENCLSYLGSHPEGYYVKQVTEYKEKTLKKMEEALFLDVVASYEAAERKKTYTEVVAAYETYRETYPEGNFLKQAAEYVEKAKKKIEELNK
jgi:outer membrane protein assembly factor BamD